MMSNTNPLSQQEAEQYLGHLQALSSELETAMQGVVARQLPAFDESLQRQRATCALLTDLPRRAAARRSSGDDEAPLDPDLASRIKEAALTLNTLNQTYSALLKHSGDTLRLFAGLCRSYSGPVAIQPRVHTWSCEL